MFTHCHSRVDGNPGNAMSNDYIYYVYILASKRNGTLYIEVTNNLVRRVYEHKNELVDGFTKEYKINILVYFETTNRVEEALKREKQLKKWERNWKLALIEKENPAWKDLYYSLL
jgi:putative endonuclease